MIAEIIFGTDPAITLLFNLDPARLVKIYWGRIRPLLFNLYPPGLLKTKVGQSALFEKERIAFFVAKRAKKMKE